jgi:cytochrome c553
MSYRKKLVEGKESAGMRKRYKEGNIIKPVNSTNSDSLKILLFALLISLALSGIFYIELVNAGTYLNSAHANSSYGVKRSASGFPTDYTKGLCGHCHEQHASIDGTEPEPFDGTPSNYGLFYSNYVNQTDNICFQCHKDISSYQTGGSLLNRSYSFRAGGWTADPVNDILEAFSFSSPGTSHKLDDIKTFITGKWGYTDDSNPCNACHNPHAAQGDPLGAPNSTKSSGTRGYPVSRPFDHSKDNNAWVLYGDDANEKMNFYTSSYQAPYRYNSTTAYEPDGSIATQDGSNLTNYVTFCTDCHNATNTIYSNTLGRNLYMIDWSSTGDKHGGRARGANGDVYDKGTLKAPYNDASSYVLSCLDCHEPHGSINAYLLRSEVNGVVISNSISASDNSNGAWNVFCTACHEVTDTGIGSACTDGLHGAPFATSLCTGCHKHDAGLCPRTAGINELF